ncbi:MAG: hypothetical protein ACYCR8_07980 [Cuniculiplasma sp.]
MKEQEKREIILNNIKEVLYMSEELEYSLIANVTKNKLIINLSIYNGLERLDENFMLNFAIKAPYILFNQQELNKVEKYDDKMVVELNYPLKKEEETSICLIDQNTFQYLNEEDYQQVKNTGNKKIVINFNVPVI